MERNGYPKQFTEKVISRQLKRPAAGKLERVINEPDQPKMEIARIPYVDGLSQEIRRIARMVGVRTVLILHAEHVAKPVSGERFPPTRDHDECSLLRDMQDV